VAIAIAIAIAIDRACTGDLLHPIAVKAAEPMHRHHVEMMPMAVVKSMPEMWHHLMPVV
jgi:hypothetical protein